MTNDNVAVLLKPMILRGQHIIYQMEKLSVDAQTLANSGGNSGDNSGDNEEWRRIALVCQRQADAFSWLVLALQERVTGGLPIDTEASILRTVADILITLSSTEI